MAMNVERMVELRFREAEARGEFSGLRGAGKPLPPDDLAWLPEDARIEALTVRLAGGVPTEVVLMREIAQLREALATAGSAEAGPLRTRLRNRALELSVLFERGGRMLAARAAAELAR